MAIACDMSCKRYAKPHTNADQIRAMTDEELAEFMWEHGGSAPNCRENKLINHTCKSCAICWLDWLKKECD